MRSICAWCSKSEGDVPPYDDPTPTHGICPDCRDREWAKYLAYQHEIKAQREGSKP